jgi:glycine/D-amino acid oxidase-like deaminating enzyme
MDGRVLIVGQGLAGTALGLECEARGIEFAIAHDGHAAAASRVAAGLVNPVTGQRWVKSARVDELLPGARERYAAWEEMLGVRLWHPLALTRLWRDAAERGAVEAKIARGELAPYVGWASDTGVEITGAAWVDLPALLAAAERRWRAAGRLRERAVTADAWRVDEMGVEWGGERFLAAILCTGAGALLREVFASLPFAAAQGEMVAVRGTRHAPDTAFIRGHWFIAGRDGTARVGATYERDRADAAVTPAARVKLQAAAEAITGERLEIIAHSAGVRLTLPDRAPVVGWHPRLRRLGVLGAFGSKGTLWAPWLARLWVEVLDGSRVEFPSDVAVGRPHLSA